MLRLTCLATLAITLPVTAQDQAQPKPAPELGRFAEMIGKWQGKGASRMDADGEFREWTATVETRLILNGFFVQEDVVVDIGDGTPWALRTIHGWDRDQQRLHTFMMGNDGHQMAGHSVWIDDHTLVMPYEGTMEGQPAVGRSIWSIEGDVLHYEAHHADGAGKWFTSVKGDFERTESIDARPTDASFMSIPVSEHLKKLSGYVGKWKLSGWMTMPGSSEKMPISGTETMTSIFGGHVLQSHAVGDPSPMGIWEGYSYVCWNQERQRYELVMIDNMGQFTHEHGWFVDDDQMVSVSAGVRDGVPTATRGLTILEDGKPKAYRAHVIPGAGEPIFAFEMNYAPAED